MSEEFFEVYEHVVPAQHLREYHFGAKSEQDELQIYVKEYRPKNNLEPDPDSVTILFAHGNSDPGPCYEPMWDDLLAACRGVKIRGIWAVDAFNKGQSSVLNEHKLGDDPSPFDLSRDMMCVVNRFKERMARPIIGVGHSSGSLSIIHLSIMHPRLFHSLIFPEPVFQKPFPTGKNSFAISTSRKRDLWPSRKDAEQWFRKNKYFQMYEERMLNAYLKYLLRETPTALYPDAPAGSVTLTASKAQDVWGIVRPNWEPRSGDPLDKSDRLLVPNTYGEALNFQSTRAECQIAEEWLPNLRPGVLWIYGTDSFINPENFRASHLARTGTGPGGSRGSAVGLVKRVDIQGAGHILPQMKPKETAQVMAEWLEGEVVRFKEETQYLLDNKPNKSKDGMTKLSDEWMTKVESLYEFRPLKFSRSLPKL